MLPVNAVEKYLHKVTPEFQEIILEIRNLVFYVAPEATERIQRSGFTYFDAMRGGTVSAGICQVLIKEDHVRLAFIHGAFLPDPKGLLQGGDRIAKRFVPIDSFGQAPWDDLKDLIAASARFDPRSLAQ